MNLVILSFIIYLVVTIVLTIWVATKLFRSGLIFLVDAFHGNKEMAQSVSQLLMVGFYLLNLGFIFLYLNAPYNGIADVTKLFKYVTNKIGVVMLFLGVMHFFNVFNFAKMRRKARRNINGDDKPKPKQKPVKQSADSKYAVQIID